MPATLLQSDSAEVFSCEFCKTFKNNYFVDHLQTDFFFNHFVNTFDVTRFYHLVAE